MPKTPVVKESNRPGFKQYEFDNTFSDDKFGKCPIQCVHPKPNEKALPSIIFNPKCQWSDSPIEAMQCALNQLTGTHDQDVAIEIIDRAVSAMPSTHRQDYNTNVIYQSLSDCEPKDAIEAKLCAQSTTLYAQGMQYLSRAEKADMLNQAEFYMKSAIKLLRLHNETVEALSRYRRKGEQKVVVQHVNVNDGGKAIVGNVIA
jgi:hypothetical protein